MAELKKFLVSPTHSIREVIKCIDGNAKGIALVVDADKKLVGTVTDGDIRRAILSGTNLDLEVQVLLERKTSSLYPTPLTAVVGTSDAQLILLMNKHQLRHIPLVDEKGNIADIALLSDLIKEHPLPLRAVVMAGGHGMRLRPLTDKIPKPMLPIGNRPVLELVIEQLRQAGIHQVNVTTHYREEVISQHFGDGRNFGVDIHYVKEDQPLGTAGALSRISEPKEPLLVVNGDILTRIDFRAMLDFHREQNADMTVAVRLFEFHIPYGVIETKGIAVSGISEKPSLRHFINAGIYLLNPDVCRFVPNNTRYDMTDLIQRLVSEKRHVVSFPVREYWLDIGQIEDYQQAISDVEQGEI